jgi:hypothetical protein
MEKEGYESRRHRLKIWQREKRKTAKGRQGKGKDKATDGETVMYRKRQRKKEKENGWQKFRGNVKSQLLSEASPRSHCNSRGPPKNYSTPPP